ncbi:hypothetical protein [Enterococcus rivorum]|uniref:Uncharacterized protein n=1 Tax=Enterococcus rivorum TaxID=762845 RepID=A0A1E5KTB9_9ENTE|nr:hypothetical protein [Enterococcus rivorum]MBP2098050.1 hypothetical protein [Enterococcus rivorum]OEH80998.1 hypothetical protein BCR26_05645 [Enterococcus rivorum]
MTKNYFSIKEVCGLISVEMKERTLRSWITKIEERTAFRFTRKINMANPHYVYGKPLQQLLLDEDEIRLLKKLYEERQDGASLLETIDRLFLLSKDYTKLYPECQRG